jgi:hypothetical protein
VVIVRTDPGYAANGTVVAVLPCSSSNRHSTLLLSALAGSGPGLRLDAASLQAGSDDIAAEWKKKPHAQR